MVIYPEQADLRVSQKSLISMLNTTGLLGAAETDTRFRPGNAFLELICFLGCSPNVALSPNQDNDPYCTIEVAASQDQIRCQFASNTRAPKCPVCRTNLSQLLCDEMLKPCYLQNCPECQTELDLTTLNWRKSAVFAQSWIEINNIFEAEAVPHDDLMQYLKKETGAVWKVAYLR